MDGKVSHALIVLWTMLHISSDLSIDSTWPKPPVRCADTISRRGLLISGTCWMKILFLQRLLTVFSERTTLRSLYAISRPSVVCCPSSVCDVGAPYSGGWTFRQFFSPYDSPGTLLFWCQKSLVGDAPFPLNCVQSDPLPLKQRNFEQYRLIAPQLW